MRMGPAAASPDAYVAGLDGWRRDRVELLRAAVVSLDGVMQAPTGSFGEIEPGQAEQARQERWAREELA